MKNLNIRLSILTVLVFLISLSFLFLTMDRVVNVYDEGLILTGAMRVGAGDMVHRDFYANYGPAQFYILSWLFDFFGQKVIVERVFDLVIRSLIIATIYVTLKIYCREVVSVLITLLCAFWLSALGNHGYPVYPVLLFSIISVLIFVLAIINNKGYTFYLIAGLLTGISAFFRYDLGFFVYVANIIASFTIIFWLKHQIQIKPIIIFNRLFIYSLATGLPVLILLVWYLSSGAIDSFIFQVITFPREYYARTRGLPFPHSLSLFSVAIYFPLMVLMVVLIALVRELTYLKNIKIDTNRIVFLVFTLWLTIAFYLKGWVRVSPEHLQLSIISSFIILGVLVEIALVNVNVRFKTIVFSLLLVGFVTSSAYLSNKFRHGSNLVIKDMSNFHTLIFKEDLNLSDSENPKNYSAFFVDKYRSAARNYIMDNTSANERIFVGLRHHDKVFVNDVSSYFLSNRLPATKWHHFDPGLQTSSHIQSEIVSDLRKNKPRYILLESTWENVIEDNESANSSGILMLDKYIVTNYHKVKSFGMIEIWRVNQ